MPGEEQTDLARRVWVVSVPVGDLDRSLAFYRDVLGFPLQLDGRAFGWMEVGPEPPLCTIGLSLTEGALPEEEIRRTGIVLSVDDMDAFAARLRAHGVRIVTEPTRARWGGVLMNFLDPDGNRLQAVYHPDHYASQPPAAREGEGP